MKEKRKVKQERDKEKETEKMKKKRAKIKVKLWKIKELKMMKESMISKGKLKGKVKWTN